MLFLLALLFCWGVVRLGFEGALVEGVGVSGLSTLFCMCERVLGWCACLCGLGGDEPVAHVLVVLESLSIQLFLNFG